MTIKQWLQTKNINYTTRLDSGVFMFFFDGNEEVASGSKHGGFAPVIFMSIYRGENKGKYVGSGFYGGPIRITEIMEDMRLQSKFTTKDIENIKKNRGIISLEDKFWYDMKVKNNKFG